MTMRTALSETQERRSSKLFQNLQPFKAHRTEACSPLNGSRCFGLRLGHRDRLLAARLDCEHNATVELSARHVARGARRDLTTLAIADRRELNGRQLGREIVAHGISAPARQVEV